MIKSKNLQNRLDNLEKLDKEKSVLVSRFLYERGSGGSGIPLQLVNQKFSELDKKYLPWYVQMVDDFSDDLGFGKVGTRIYRGCLESLQKTY